MAMGFAITRRFDPARRAAARAASLWSRWAEMAIGFTITRCFDPARRAAARAALCGQSSLLSKSFFGLHTILTRNRPFVVKVACYPNRFLDYTLF
ncbi:MAG: hypothetical protein QM296_05515 [Bacillota bacterium]|nr:hypothetical protein [Bacillota bacterium]